MSYPRIFADFHNVDTDEARSLLFQRYREGRSAIGLCWSATLVVGMDRWQSIIVGTLTPLGI